MKLYIRNGDITTEVHNLLNIKVATGMHELQVVNNTIIINGPTESYDEWMGKYINIKKNAILKGGLYDPPSHKSGFNFKSGITGMRVVRTINGAVPDARGNIQLLPGKTLDVHVKVVNGSNHVILSRINVIKGSSGEGVIIDIHRCVWYLYHTLNSLIYRMNIWRPSESTYPMFQDARLLGVIPTYQALVAAWNLRVWRKSFIWDINVVRDGLSFNIGYIALNCKNPRIKCRITISNVLSYNNTTRFLTIYDQGNSTNTQDNNIVPIITKHNKNGTETTVSGKGTDDSVTRHLDWKDIVIELNIGELSQGEYYKTSLALALAQNEAVSLYYQGVDGDKKHKLKVTTEWITDTDDSGGSGSEIYSIKDVEYEIQAILTTRWGEK